MPVLHLCRRRIFRQLTLPARDDRAGQTIADHVDRGARHVHERVNAENNKDRFRRQMKSGCGSQQDHDHRARYASQSLAREHEGEHHQ